MRTNRTVKKAGSVLCEQAERVRLWAFYLRFCSLTRLCHNGHTRGAGDLARLRGGTQFLRPSNLIWVMRITQPCISAAGRAAVFMRNPRRSRRAVPNGHSGSCCVSGALRPNRRMVNLTSDGHRLCASNVISFAGLSAAVALGCRASPRDAFSLGHDGGSIG